MLREKGDEDVTIAFLEYGPVDRPGAKWSLVKMYDATKGVRGTQQDSARYRLRFQLEIRKDKVASVRKYLQQSVSKCHLQRYEATIGNRLRLLR